MQRCQVLLGVLWLCGCDRYGSNGPVLPPKNPQVLATTTAKAANEESEPVSISALIDWPRAHEKSYRIDPKDYDDFGPCLVFDPAYLPPDLREKYEANRKEQEAKQVIEQMNREWHGPHYYRYIVVRTNPEAAADFREGNFPLPVGSTIIKEKHQRDDMYAAPRQYAAMIKREPGYDPEHADWEYFYVDRGFDRRRVTRGRIQSCIECHEKALDNDYLFRTYLQPDV